jgi:hypothetical protein
MERAIIHQDELMINRDKGTQKQAFDKIAPLE